MKRILPALLATLTLHAAPTLCAGGGSASGLVERLAGAERAANVAFTPLAAAPGGGDRCRVSAAGGRVAIEASSPSAAAYAFHTYLRDACRAMASWSCPNPALPDRWPDYQGEIHQSPYRLRYFLNVCTYGYTMPYWDWPRWERELDLMALHGVNMPLATVAAEAIAERVWLRMGLSKEQVREFFTGPAFLPWHRMGNLNAWSGPLTDNWHASQVALQHKILDRMRELGMHPVAPAFAGFVPAAFVEMHPEVSCTHLSWGGFDPELNAYVLPPDSPFFEQIGKLFIEEWQREFGPADYFLSDSFNEMRLPVDPADTAAKHSLLADYGEAIYRSIAAGNPDAVWVTQGWTFGYQHDFWTADALQALLARVPNDKMLIIDLGCDYPKWVWHTEPTWSVHNGFYGKQWIFSYVPNFGGKSLPTGDLAMYASASAHALAAPNRGNLVGFGSAPEGLENNEVVYELLSDMAWTDAPIDLEGWTVGYCRARYGACPDAMARAWALLRSSVYSALRSYPRFTWQTLTVDRRRKSIVDFNGDFAAAVGLFLDCADTLGASPHYRADALELSACLLAVKADSLHRQALHCDSVGEQGRAAELTAATVALLAAADSLLASHPTMRLAPWVEAARAYGIDDAEKARYEADAKRLITLWGGHQEDYAARFWAGLIKNYYIPRLQLYFSPRRATLNEWKARWVETPWADTSAPYADPLTRAKQLIDQARTL